MLNKEPLSRSFYERNTVEVARDLLGKILIRTWNGNRLAGIISEVEAYCDVIDPASHAYRTKTDRNAAMFGRCGQSYIYFIYGNHYCLNLVSREQNTSAGGILLRSIIPIAGRDSMQQLRRNIPLTQLTNGPGKICQALALNHAHNMLDITAIGELYVTQGVLLPDTAIEQTPRIGISKAQDRLWRFIINDKTTVFLRKQYDVVL